MEKVLLFAPHFDDESIACGGTLAKHVRAGDEVVVIFMTNGNSGSTLGDNLSQTEYAQLRSAEAADAMRVLGITRYECLELEEGFMRFTPELEKQLITIIRRITPSIVYLPHENENHNDHVVTNVAVTQAVHRARWTYFPHLGSKPHTVSEIRAYEVSTPLQRPNLYVDITETAGIKEDAIKSYKSQLIHCDYHLASLGLSRYRGMTGPGVAFAEAFHLERLNMVE